MKILIAGGGYNGTTIAKYFVSEKHNEITIIDISEKVINRITSSMPLGGMVGSATDTKVLEDAGIKDADVFIATCPNDETNLFTCSMITDIYQTKTKIAKVTSRRYFADNKMYNYLHGRHNKLTNIDHLIVPNVHIVENIIHRMMYCNTTVVGADGIETTAIKIISIKCCKHSSFINKTPEDIIKDLSGYVSLLGVKRVDDFILNAEDLELKEDDIIELALNESSIEENINILKLKNNERPGSESEKRDVTIIGSNELSVSLAKEVQRYDVGKVDIIVSDLARAKKLSYELNSYGINVINVNIENKENIQQLNLKHNSYYFVNEDKEEDSVIICFLLRQYGVRNLFSYMDSKIYYDILKNHKINHVLSPERFIVSDIIPFVRAGVVYNAKVIEEDFELLYAEILDGCAYNGRSVKYVNNEGVKILGIVKDDNLVTVSNDFILTDKTRILILYNKDKLNIVEQGLDAFYS